MPSREEAIGSCVILLFTIFITGIVYLALANSFSDSYIGILKEGNVFTDVSCTTTCDNNKHCTTNCDNTYYIEEIFYKNANTMSTCTVRRLTPYYFKGDANNFVSRMILGTTRQLYQTTYSHGTCIDDKIRDQYNAIGGTLFGFSLFIFIVILSFLRFPRFPKCPDIRFPGFSRFSKCPDIRFPRFPRFPRFSKCPDISKFFTFKKSEDVKVYEINNPISDYSYYNETSNDIPVAIAIITSSELEPSAPPDPSYQMGYYKV